MTGEQRASRDVPAGWEGKALKAEILRADVARNKATRPGRAQTVERVRNSENGRCWWWNTSTTIAWVQTSKGAEPQGRRRRISAACLALTDHFGGSSAGNVALAQSGMVTLPRKFSARSRRIWDSSASRCGQTLKWRPRAWEAERWRCLHRKRSTR
jgi:hypothetical protein